MTHTITRKIGLGIGNGPALTRGIAVFALLLVALLAFTAPAMAVENGGNHYVGSTSQAHRTIVVDSAPSTSAGDDAGSTILCTVNTQTAGGSTWPAPGNPVTNSKVTGSQMQNSKTRVLTAVATLNIPA